ncbi:MAG: GIY-YIG nuclease family protein [Patescibacteria group bacterium]
MTDYYVYILECRGGTLYTGITTNLERRFLEHQKGVKGAKYTTANRPVKLVYQKKFIGRSAASVEEARIKKLSRAEKLLLITNKYNTLK